MQVDEELAALQARYFDLVGELRDLYYRIQKMKKQRDCEHKFISHGGVFHERLVCEMCDLEVML